MTPQAKEIIPRTPRAHIHHDGAIPCCCSSDRSEDYQVCWCGAAYTIEIVTFPVFECYDCGAKHICESLRWEMSLDSKLRKAILYGS